MADGLSVSEGSTGSIKKVATDELTDATLGAGNFDVQFVKLMDGTLGGTAKGALKNWSSTPPTTSDPALLVINSPVGEVADGSTDTGTGNKIAAKAAAGLATGTNVTAGQRADLAAGLDRVLYVRPTCGLEDIISAVSAAVTTTTSTTLVAAGGAGVKNYITSIAVSNTSATATELLIQDGSGGTTKWLLPVPAGSGAVQNFQVPLGTFTANTAIFFAATVAASIRVSINAFRSKI